MDDLECLITSSICLFFTVFSACAHLILGGFYYSKTGTFPLKEKIIGKVGELRGQRTKRHKQSDPIEFSD